MSGDREGIFLCLVGPAGSGKSSLGEALRNQPNQQLGLSISVTTRGPRTGEQDGVHYHFVSAEEFQQRIDRGEFFEHEATHGNRYGTLKATLEEARRSGKDLLFDVDIRGALNLKRGYRQNTVIVFLVPPSTEALIERIKKRGAISEQELTTRLETARREYDQLKQISGDSQAIDYLVVNEQFEATLTTLRSVLSAERTRLSRFRPAYIETLCALPGGKR